MNALFDYLSHKDDTPLLIKSCVFHYELQFIHPFTDGNGRLGRLWNTVILRKYHPVFEYTPLESIVGQNRAEYYKSLERSDKKGDSTPFVEFMLQSIKTSLLDLLSEIRVEKDDNQKRLSKASQHFKSETFTRKEYMKLHLSLSTATASRDLKKGVDDNLLKKTGNKALAVYSFKKRYIH
jgi:Fic family protein